MQSKKRAKPVKFGAKEKKETHEPSPSKEKEEIKEAESPEKKEEDTSSHNADDSKVSDKEIEAHFSSIETLDITESVEESPEETVSLSPNQEESVPATTEPSSTLVGSPLTANGEDAENFEKTSDTESVVDEQSTSPEKDGEFFSLPPDQYDKKKSMTPYFLKVVLATFLVGLIFFAGIYYAVSSKSVRAIFSTKITPVATTAQPPQKPTPKPVDLSAYSIAVQNGTPTAGAAAKLKTQLTDAGFKVISAGNAGKDTYEKTQIAASKKVDKAYLSKLEEILKKTYILGSASTLSSGSADVLITIGSASAK